MSKVLVIGSSNIDIVYNVDRLPKLGETIAGSNINKLPGGKGLNQAVAASRVFNNTYFLGCFGNESSKAFFKDILDKENLNIENVKQGNLEAGTAIITVCDNDNTIIVIPSANNEVDIDYIIKNISLFEKDTIVVLQNEIKQEVNEFIINYCYENNIKTIYNPAPARKINLDLIDKVTYFTPNETEAEFIFENMNYNQIIEKYPNKVIITIGKDGVMYYDKELINIKPSKVKVVDTTGAGDTLNGILAACIAENINLNTALEIAVKGATKSVTKFGAQGGMPYRKDQQDEKTWDFE
ncbi:ribokinase [Mycoplasma sp. P36-A1]|uniref:ribokinase n=1 Tax=Mycoplasma sp. P36-A1 TaxID=3252900 RepID=UPI003C2B5200